MAAQWTAPVRAVAAPARRVVAVPHAGAGPYALMPVLRMLPPDIEVVGVTLPGRERRFAESAIRTASDPGAVVAAILVELAALPPRPTVLFGHSMGAALAAALVVAAPRCFAGLVVSAYPSEGSAAHRAGRWPEAELLELVRRGGCTPSDVISSPVWRRTLLEVLHSDLTLACRLAAEIGVDTLAVPVTVLAGVDDDVARHPSVVGWGPSARIRVLPGAHFYLLDSGNAPAVAAEIGLAFGSVPTGAEPPRRPPVS